MIAFIKTHKLDLTAMAAAVAVIASIFVFAAFYDNAHTDQPKQGATVSYTYEGKPGFDLGNNIVQPYDGTKAGLGYTPGN